jgi:CheY-like chemotaxis protein
LHKPVKQSDLREAIAAALRLSAASPAAAPIAGTPRQGRQLRVLVAEDNVINQKLARCLLEERGHEVTTVVNGREAIQVSERQHFDLVLMDVQMPELDGLEATAAIRRREAHTGRHLPIIAMTAYAMSGDRDRCLAAGVDGYLSKPIRGSDLWLAIEEVLAKKLSPDNLQVASATPIGNTLEEFLPILDRNSLLGRLADKEAQRNDIVRLFLETECPRLMAELTAALQKRSIPDVKRAVHTLKGTVGSLGACAAYEAARRLEALSGGQASIEALRQAHRELESEIRRLQPALRDFAGMPPVP